MNFQEGFRLSIILMAMISESAHNLHEIRSAPETINEHKKNKKPSEETRSTFDKSVAPECRNSAQVATALKL